MTSNSNIWGKKVIEKALEYANYKWTANEKNVLHGIDENGRFVDTPDITWKGNILDCGWWKVGEVNVGIPYGWGNASTIEEFESGIREGKYAGNVLEDKTRKEIVIIDSARSTGKVSQRKVNVAELFASGYEIYRKK